MRALLLALLTASLLGGCAQRQALFVVLPNPDGSAGAVSIEDGKSSVLLDKPYAAGEVRGGAAQPTEVKPDEVQKVFGAALASQPILPERFVLYFVQNTDKLTAESETLYRGVLDDIKRRPVYQVEVIGYTDSTGTQEANQRLSRQRAAMVRDKLVADGIAGAAISTAGRGKLDQAVRTADEMPEPRNRRVVITVR